MNKWYLHVVLFSASILSATAARAASAENLPYPIEPALNVEVVLHQQELDVDVTKSQIAAAAGAFGLVGALVGATLDAAIDTASAQNAEKRVADIRNLLLDYNFNQAIEDSIKTAVTSPGISPAPVVIVRKTVWDSVAEQAAPLAEPKQTVLRLVPRYAVAGNFESMTVSMMAYYVQRTVKDSGKIKESVIFSRNYSFELPLDKIEGSGADEDADRWVAIGKDGLVALLNQGVKQIGEMLAYDFSIEGRNLSGNAKIGKTTQFKGKSYRGALVREEPEYIWVASGKSKARSITGVQPVTEAVTAALAATSEAAHVPDQASVPVDEPAKE